MNMHDTLFVWFKKITWLFEKKNQKVKLLLFQKKKCDICVGRRWHSCPVIHLIPGIEPANWGVFCFRIDKIKIFILEGFDSYFLLNNKLKTDYCVLNLIQIDMTCVCMLELYPLLLQVWECLYGCRLVVLCMYSHRRVCTHHMCYACTLIVGSCTHHFSLERC